DDEQIQNDDPARVDQDLNRGQEWGAEQDVERCHEQEVEHEKQHAVHGVLGRDDEHGEPEDARGDEVEGDRLSHYRNITFTIPVRTRLAIASGINTFHPSRISWS